MKISEEMENVRLFGLEVLGDVLQHVREDAKLNTEFAAAPPLKMSANFVRMVEAGKAYVPLDNAAEYAAALSSRAEAGGMRVDPTNLLFALISLRGLKKERKDSQFDWVSIRGLGKDAACQFVLGKLTSSVVQRQAPQSFASLNPIQLQLVSEIASRVAVLGNSIVTDMAAADWEERNAKNIQSVAAAVTCLRSELSGAFAQSFQGIAQNKNFEGFRYLVSHEDSKVAQNAFHEIKRNFSDQASEKLNFATMTRGEFDEINKALIGSDPEHKAASGWDAFYLYELREGPPLMFGVFRRFPINLTSFPKVSLRSWGGEPINEVLSHALVSQFRDLHERLWDENFKSGDGQMSSKSKKQISSSRKPREQ